MAYEPKEKKISMFKNTRFNPKTTEGRKQPVMTGNCKIDGVIYRVALWYATDEEGRVKRDIKENSYFTGQFTNQQEWDSKAKAKSASREEEENPFDGL